MRLILDFINWQDEENWIGSSPRTTPDKRDVVDAIAE